MSQIIIRPLRPEDKPPVIHILQNTPEFLPFEVVVAEELIDAYVESSHESGYHIMVAEMDHHVIGYVCYGQTALTESTWDIYWIAVDGTRQGHGIGRALMLDTESRIKTLGGRLVVVETSSKPNYNKTRQFYVNLKYKEIARIPDFYAQNDDEVIYIKRVDREA
jgi:ribosomal protein S18 acetylase RimI-like enzyme